MAFASDDPRSKLRPIAAPEPTTLAPAQAYRIDPGQPDEVGEHIRTWYGCAKNFVVSYSEAEEGATISREGEVDEHICMLHDDSEVVVESGTERVTVQGRSLIIIPPGSSRIEVKRGGRIVCSSTARSAPDLMAKASADPRFMDDPNAAPYAPYPPPFDGYRIRVYDLDAEPVKGSFSAVWRCSSFLILRGGWREGQRDITRMSAHTHVNFQQCNVVLEGTFAFHLRWPWIHDKRQWMPDAEEVVSAPGLMMTPAQALHTVEWVGSGMNHCIDIYAPPRPDFAELGWAINDAEYPLPA